jgi:hypothetical protein
MIMADKDIKTEDLMLTSMVVKAPVKDIKTVTKNEIKLHKVKFISTLLSFDFKYFTGDIVELTDEVYEIAKRYNSVEDV